MLPLTFILFEMRPHFSQYMRHTWNSDLQRHCVLRPHNSHNIIRFYVCLKSNVNFICESWLFYCVKKKNPSPIIEWGSSVSQKVIQCRLESNVLLSRQSVKVSSLKKVSKCILQTKCQSVMTRQSVKVNGPDKVSKCIPLTKCQSVFSRQSVKVYWPDKVSKCIFQKKCQSVLSR